MARLAATALLERKGENLTILGMEEVLPITDYFVICSGRNARHVDSLRELVEKRLKEHGVPLVNRTGRDSKSWILLDYGWVVVHIFQPEYREFYDLEMLWSDAEVVDLDAFGVEAPPESAEPGFIA